MRRRRNAVWRGLWILAGASLLVFVALAGYAHFKLSNLVLGGLGESFSTRVYAAPFILNSAVRQSPERLMERLNRAGYRSVQDVPAEKGEFFWAPPDFRVHLRGFETPSLRQPEQRMRWVHGEDHSWKIYAEDGTVLPQAAIEPEISAELSGAKRVRREPARWEEIPRHVWRAVVAAEDRRFFRHWGFDWRAIARAAWSNIKNKGPLQGGSTITQQVAKNLLLSPKRTWTRKAMEAALSVYLEIRYSKEELLTLYLNHVYWGQDGPVSVAGIKTAAKFYFGKEPAELSFSQAALLAGMIRSPYRYNPFLNPDTALKRRDFILRAMRVEGYLTLEESERAQAEPLGLRRFAEENGGRDENAYFIAEVIRRLMERYDEQAIFHSGLSIHTTMDPLMQGAAQRAVARASPQGALAALDFETGRVLALSGGRNFKESQFNRATQALRQPGSAFKPFVYGAALEDGWTPSSFLLDEPLLFKGAEGALWQPKNFDKVYHGTVTVRQALALSMNAATLDLAQKTKPGRVIRFAQKLGVESPLAPDLGIALGSSEVTLLELVSSYAAFANGGFRIRPHLITSVLDAEGKVLEFTSWSRTQVLEPAQAYLMTSLLQSVVEFGTAKSLTRMGWTRPAAGKTGTSSKGRDAWFVGYTPEILTGVWVGDDEDAAVHASGSKDALPVWASFMKEALADYPSEPFVEPTGVARVKIDPLSGLKAVSGCPERREELFVEGTEPTQTCPLHKSGISGWFKRLFGGE